MAEQDTGIPAPGRSRIISKMLPPAVRLWLRSQLEAAEALQFQIEGDDRQILSGHIARVTLTAQQVIYQGIAISQISAIGQGIRINLGEVLRGKPLRLMQAVPIQVEAKLTEADLNAALQTPLLANALAELLLDWLRVSHLREWPQPIAQGLPDQPLKLHHLQVIVRPDQLVFAGTLVSDPQSPAPFAIATGLQVIDGTKLRLDRPQELEHSSFDAGRPLAHLQGYEIDLGSDLNIQQLTLKNQHILCAGSINVLP